MSDKTTKCPECGCEYFKHKNELGYGYRVCSHCGQEWWADIDYTESDNNGWISVDDRLPEVGQTVDVYMKKKRFACNRLTDVRWMKSLNKFRATRTGRHYNLEQISHWMPLPEPPTK